MSGKVEYLEKYAVAPAPSRDYYGLKVLRDEVILHLWKVSHGPHKAPIVRISKFSEFGEDRLLQDEISCGFGIYVLQHVKNITRRDTNTILTLPKDLIQEIIAYLKPQDIVNLSLLCHAARIVFSDYSLQEFILKKFNLSKGLTNERRNMAHAWKNMFKEHQSELSIKNQKVSRMRTAEKQDPARFKPDIVKINNTKLKSTTGSSMSTVNALRKPVEVSKKSSPRDSLIKKPLNIQLKYPEKTPMENKKNSPSKRNLINKPIKKDQKNTSISSSKSIAKTELQGDFENHESKSNISDFRRSIGTRSKIFDFNKNGPNHKASENRRALNGAKKSSDMRSTMTRQSFPIRNSNDNREKGAAKSLGQSKSAILQTDKFLMNDIAALRESDFGLADLMATNAKHNQSTGSMLDYNFGYLNKRDLCAGDSKGNEGIGRKADSPRVKKVNQGHTTLDRLSEKSESLHAESINSDSDDDETCSTYFSEKHSKGWTEKMMNSLTSLEARASRIHSDKPIKDDIFCRFPTPKELDEMIESKCFSTGGASDRQPVKRDQSGNTEPVDIASELFSSKDIDDLWGLKNTFVKKSLDGLSTVPRKSQASGADSSNPFTKYSPLKKIGELADTKYTTDRAMKNFQSMDIDQLEQFGAMNVSEMATSKESSSKKLSSTHPTRKDYSHMRESKTVADKYFGLKKTDEPKIKAPVSAGILNNINMLKSFGTNSLAARTSATSSKFSDNR